MIELFQHSTILNKIINMDALPFNAFQKDLQGRYINCNDRTAISAGFNSKNDLIGLTDLENKFIQKKCVENFKRNDQQVIATQETSFFTEPVSFTNKLKVVALSQKAPLIHENKIIGSFGFSFVIKKNDIADLFSILLNFSMPADFNLTRRELSVIQHLIKNRTAKQIAQLLKISARTAEQHIENIKNKFGVTRKQEIIEKMICILSDFT